MSKPKLTPKQEAFALAYVETGNASEAYRRAYDVSESSMPQSVWQEASRTLAGIKVASRVMELQQAARERTLVTIESITKQLEQVRQAAFNAGDYAPANTSIMGMAKVNGLLVDRNEHTGKDGGAIVIDSTPAEIAASIESKLAGIAAAIGTTTVPSEPVSE